MPVLRRAVRTLAELLLYAALAVATVWPLPQEMTTALPLGTEPAATVPLFNLWTLWWNADRAAEGFDDYWHAPIFAPTTQTFAFSEPQPTTLVVAPFVWCADTPILAYNLYLLLALVLNGWAAYRLLLRIGLSGPAALVGGAMVETLPFIHWQIGVLQLVPLFGVIWTFHALYDLAEKPHWTAGARLGAAIALTYMLCNHYGLFVCVLLLPAAPWLWWRQAFHWRAWAWLALGGVICLALIWPMVSVQLAVVEHHQWTRSRELVQFLSAQPNDLLTAPWSAQPPLPAKLVEAREWAWRVFPGLVKLSLACVGLLAGLWFRRWRWWSLFCLTIAVTATLLALGPNLEIGSERPYWWFYEHVPGFAQLRNVYRFAVFTQLVVALSAAVGLQIVCMELWRLGRSPQEHAGSEPVSPSKSEGVGGSLEAASTENRTAHEAAQPTRPIWAFVAAGAVLLIGSWGAGELWPPPQSLYHPPPVEQHAAWIDWINQRTRTNAVVCCLPFVRGTTAEAYVATTEWMYLNSFHRRPLVNGYSGFFPDHFRRLKGAMLHFPDKASLDALKQSGVTWLVADHGKISPSDLLSHPATQGRLQFSFWDHRAQVDVYFLER